ncbi:biotin-independent malonate decarboxylase subunit gamma [Bradyrhizobium sp. 31Argb]|uniref:biotin-independent malonate decarboxylase subunit gamma n=1 Tax=Bradyrhizobium sp. 31Argb TaxID=3141247 RepID=UPI003747BB22
MTNPLNNRGRKWFEALTGSTGKVDGNPGSLMVAEANLGGEKAVFVGVAPDANARFPRTGHTEVGLEEGWYGTKNLRAVIEADKNGPKRPIITVCDSKSQAYGRREELFGIHLAAAAIIAAYADARTAGHPVIALIVGRCVSGSFLALAGQANRMIAFDDPEVLIHAMYKDAAARITRRSVAELDKLGETIVPMAYDIGSFNKLGGLHSLLKVANPDTPAKATVEQVKSALIEAIADARNSPRTLDVRLESDGAKAFRKGSIKVRELMTRQWAPS